MEKIEYIDLSHQTYYSVDDFAAEIDETICFLTSLAIMADEDCHSCKVLAERIGFLMHTKKLAMNSELPAAQ
jgi:hypothetical protein